MNTRFAILTSLCLILASDSLRAQPAAWRDYSNSNNPNCVIADGPYLWIGTDGGLVRFDRRADTFVVFTSSNSGLPQNRVASLTRDTSGAVWVGTTGAGLARTYLGAWTVFNTSNSALPDDNVGSLAADSLGRVWIGTSSGLTKYDRGTWSTYTTTNSPMHINLIYSLAADAKGNVWIGTKWVSNPQGSLFKFDGGSAWEEHNTVTDKGYSVGDEIWSLMVARDGSLWLGDWGVMQHIVGRTWSQIHVQPDRWGGGSYNYVRGITEDDSGVWVASESGLGHWNGASWTVLAQESKTYPFLYGCAKLSGGVIIDGYGLWSAGSNGIANLNGSAWTAYPQLSNSSLSSNYIYAMTMDSKGRYWFGGRGSATLSMFDGATWTNYDTLIVAGNSMNAMVMSLCADSSGSVWIGTGTGITKFDGMTAQHFDLNGLLKHSNVVSALAYDKRGVLWIGTQWQGGTGLLSGLVRFDGTNWTAFNYSDTTLPWPEISSIAIDSIGHVWASMWSKGIVYFDGVSTSNWLRFDPSNSALPSDQVMKVAIAPNGDLWAATASGAAKWDGSAWTLFTTGNSGILSSPATCGVDNRGNVWFGVTSGVCRFDGTTWTHFTTQNSPIGSNFIENIIGGRDGIVWFATYDAGVVEYIPIQPMAAKASGVVFPDWYTCVSQTKQATFRNMGADTILLTRAEILGPASFTFTDNGSQAMDLLYHLAPDSSIVFDVASRQSSEGTSTGQVRFGWDSAGVRVWSYAAISATVQQATATLTVAGPLDADGGPTTSRPGSTVMFPIRLTSQRRPNFEGTVKLTLKYRSDLLTFVGAYPYVNVAHADTTSDANGNGFLSLTLVNPYHGEIAHVDFAVMLAIDSMTKVEPVSVMFFGASLYDTLCIDDTLNASSIVASRVCGDELTRTLLRGESILIEGISPNPANNVVQLRLNVPKDGTLHIIMTNMLGKQVFEQENAVTAGKQNIALEISSLSPGSYAVEVTNGEVRVRRRIEIVR